MVSHSNTFSISYFLPLFVLIQMRITIYKPSGMRIRNKKQCSANGLVRIYGYECHKQKLPVVKQRLPSGIMQVTVLNI